jgi:hypothetical protein
MASEIKVDTISEKTSAGGVTIDGLLIKDGGISGDVSLIGTTPTFTIGDAGAEDAALVFDGNAQDFYIALDDSADDLVIGKGSTVGTTPAVSIDENLQVIVHDNLSLLSDSSVLKFGTDGDTTLTHTDGTGLTLNSTNKLCFNDASQFIQGSSATVLSIGATDEIDLTATAVDLNGTLNVSGVATFQSTPVFPDGSLAIADLDIDGGTDIGANLVDADLLIVDDGAGGTNRKTAMSRIKTYIGDSTLNEPIFQAYPSASHDQTISNDTLTVVEFDAETFDPDSKFASNAFTPTVAGKYFVYVNVAFASTDVEALSLYITKNGTNVNRIEVRTSASGTQSQAFNMCGAIDCDADDAIGVKLYLTNDDITVYDFESAHTRTVFCGFRIGD